MISNPRDVDLYLEELERKKFTGDELKMSMSKVVRDLNVCRADRESSEFNKRYKMGVRFLKGDLKYGAEGTRKNPRSFINFPDKNLKYKAAELQAADVNVEFKTNDGINYHALDLLSLESTFVFDNLEILRRSDQVVKDMFFLNWGSAYVGWNPHAEAGVNWPTGFPYFQRRPSNAIYVNPGIKEADLSDITLVFDEFGYTTQEFKELFPEFVGDVFKESQDEVNVPVSVPNTDYDDPNIILGTKLDGTTQKKVYVYRHQYKRTHKLKTRILIYKDTGKVSHWLDSDYRKYLKEVLNSMLASGVDINLVFSKFGEKLGDNPDFTEAMEAFLLAGTEKEAVDVLDIIAQSDESDNLIFPDTVVASVADDRVYDRWYEIQFVNGVGTLVDNPTIRRRTNYVFFPGDFDPEYSYPISMASKLAPLFEIHSAILTMQLIYSLKFNKPQLVIIPGSIQNEKQFRANFGDPDIVVREVPGWREQGGYPANQKPYYYIYPHEMGKVAELLEQKIEFWIDDYSRSVPTKRGMSESADESGRAIIQKTINAKQGDKTDLYKMGEYFKNIFEIIKDLTAEMKDGIAHRTKYIDENYVDVNTEEANSMINVYHMTNIEVHMEDSVDIMMERKKIEAYNMLKNNLITSADALRRINPSDVDRLIINKRSEDEVMQLMAILEEYPEIRPAIEQIIQQVQQQAPEEGQAPGGGGKKPPARPKDQVSSPVGMDTSPRYAALNRGNVA